jgi:hypothetical protein
MRRLALLPHVFLAGRRPAPPPTAYITGRALRAAIAANAALMTFAGDDGATRAGAADDTPFAAPAHAPGGAAARTRDTAPAHTRGTAPAHTPNAAPDHHAAPRRGRAA